MQPTITHGSLKLLLALTWPAEAVHPVVTLSCSFTLWLSFNATSCSHEHLVWPAGRFGSFARLWLSWGSFTNFFRQFWGLNGGFRVTTWLSVQDCWTALISAAKEGHIEVVRELLENHANLEHRDLVRRWTDTWKTSVFSMTYWHLFCVWRPYICRYNSGEHFCCLVSV